MHTVSVTVLSDQKDFEIDDGSSIFDQLQDQGLELPHGCLAGACGTCKVEVLKGAENLSEPGAVEKDTLKTIYETYNVSKDKTLRLSCRSKAKGPCHIKPFSKKKPKDL